MALKKNPAEEYESINIRLDKKKFPKAYAAKVQELVNSGLSTEDAETFIDTTAFEMEVYYSPERGLFLVEAEAVDATEIFDPYTGTAMEEADEDED